MDNDLNLLFAVLALQSGLITSDQFVEACTVWTTKKGKSLGDILLERGWIVSGDVAHVRYLVNRKVERQGGDSRLSLSALDDDLKRQLAKIDDAEIQQSLCYSPHQESARSAITVDGPLENAERYSLIRLHATGGGGRVWLAHDSQLDRDVALKELRSEVADDEAVWARFQREARITGQLEHPGIVPVYDYGRQAKRRPFYTMRFVNGRTLTEAAREFHRNRASGQFNPLELVSLLNAFNTVCNTISYAHSHAVIHRDLKGQNVVLGSFGEVVVLDWGLAKVVGEHEADDGVHDSAPHHVAPFDLTIQGQRVGTPGYMAPEQAAGRPDLVDRRTDIYGLGAMLYEILTGNAPFTGSDSKEVMRRVLTEEPPPPSRTWPDVPEALEKICRKAMAKKTADRYDRAADLARDVQFWQDLQRRQAEEERDQFFNLSLDLYCVAGFDGYFKRMNPAWERMLGFTVAELLARPWLEFVHPDDRAPTMSVAETSFAAGETIVSFVNRYRCKDGSYKWLSWSATPVIESQLVYCSARDVTEQLRSQEILRESETRYRSVIASLDEGILVLDAAGTIEACNASAERILGLSADEIVGRTSADPRWGTVYEDGSPFPKDAYPVTATLRTGQPCSNVLMGIHKPDGNLNWISINSEPLKRADGNTIYGVLATFADVSELKRTREVLDKTRNELEELQLQMQTLKRAKSAPQAD